MQYFSGVPEKIHDFLLGLPLQICFLAGAFGYDGISSGVKMFGGDVIVLEVEVQCLVKLTHQ